jgi:hypothetical protein
MAYEKEIEELVKKAQELLGQAEELKAKAAKEAEEGRVGLLWRPEVNDTYFVIRQNTPPDGVAKFQAEKYKRGSKDDAMYKAVPVFRTEEQALAFADAFQVMLELRSQPGIIKPDGKQKCWYIHWEFSHIRDHIQFDECYNFGSRSIGPAFSTEEHARAAAENVGLYRIRKAFKTLFFVVVC